jgi:hypothetical protein
MKLAAEHNKAVIKCEVEQELATIVVLVQSGPHHHLIKT